MIRDILDWIWDHVWLTLGILVGLILVWRWWGSGSGSAGSGGTTVDPSLVQAGMQAELQTMAIAASTQQAQLAAAAESERTAAQVAIAGIAAQLQTEQAELAAGVAHHQLTVSADAQKHADTLAAAIATQQMQTAADIAAAQQATQQAVIQSNAATQAALIASQTQMAQISSQTTIAVAEAQKDSNIGVAKASNKGWCFVTTACCDRLGLADDCYELTKLRELRDGYVARLPDGLARIVDYYARAPLFVVAINDRPAAAQIWRRIHREYILPTALAVDVDPARAVAIYSRMMVDMEQYLPCSER